MAGADILARSMATFSGMADVSGCRSTFTQRVVASLRPGVIDRALDQGCPTTSRIDRGNSESTATDQWGTEMFRRILVALDDSDAARSAFVFVTDWVRQLDAEVWFIVLTEESSRRRCEVVSDVRLCGRLPSNTFTVSGATRRARNFQLASGIADAARAYRADLIVLGLDPRRMTRQRFTKGVRELLTGATDLPVMAPQKPKPTRAPASRKSQTQPQAPIALGPVRDSAVTERALVPA